MRVRERRNGTGMNTVRVVAVSLAVIVPAMLLGASLYDTVVLAPNLQGAPASIEHARGFLHITNPGMLFRVLSPLTQVCLLVALILVWKADPVARWRLASALVLAVIADVITFTFHYPRNAILFQEPMTRTPQEYERIAAEWAAGNYVRVVLVVAVVLLAMTSLIHLVRRTS